jgi:hypothetical protein
MTKPVEPHQIDLAHQENLKAALVNSAIIARWTIARRNIGIGATICGTLLCIVWVTMYHTVVPWPILIAISGLAVFVLGISVGVIFVLHQQSHIAMRANLEDSLHFDMVGAINDSLGQLLRDTVNDLAESETTITYGEKMVTGVEVLTERRSNLQRRITSLFSEMKLQEAIRAMVTEAMGIKSTKRNIALVTQFMEVHSTPLDPTEQKTG